MVGLALYALILVVNWRLQVENWRHGGKQWEILCVHLVVPKTFVGKCHQQIHFGDKERQNAELEL